VGLVYVPQCPHLHAGATNLFALLDALLPDDSDAIQELLDEVGAGRVWAKVLPVPPPIGCFPVRSCTLCCSCFPFFFVGIM